MLLFGERLRGYIYGILADLVSILKGPAQHIRVNSRVGLPANGEFITAAGRGHPHHLADDAAHVLRPSRIQVRDQ